MEEYNESFFDQHDKDLIERYERMVAEGRQLFFDVDEFEEIIDYYIGERSNTRAFEVLDMAKSQHPLASDILLREAELLSSVGDHDRALRIIEGLEQREPFNIDVILTKANIFSLMGSVEQSIMAYERALSKTTDEDQRIDIMINLGFEMQITGNFEEGLKYLKQALILDPENDDILYEVAYCYENSGQLAESVEFFQNYIDNNPYSSNAWYNLGNSYYGLGLFEKSIEAYDFAVVIDPRFSSAFFNMANAYVALKDFETAIEKYRESLLVEELDSITYFYIAECFAKMERYKEAEEHYRKALDSDPNLTEAWMGLALVKDAQGKSYEALLLLHRGVGANDKSGEIWSAIGDLCVKMDMVDDAVESYERAISLGYEHPDMWMSYADLLFDMNDMDEVSRVMEAAIKVHPASARLLFRLAAYLIKNGQLQEAMDFIALGLKNDRTKVDELLDFCPEALFYPEIDAMINDGE